MDGLQAFSFICDNLPQWQERLDGLAHTVHERHTEFRRLSRVSSGGSSLRRQRTGSTESLRPQDEAVAVSDEDGEASKPVTPPMHVAVDPGAKRLFQEYRLQTKRKRASGSIVSNASGTTVPRSRLSLIVYYDSSIQEGFEAMVRGVSAARNNLRKGKTAASMRARMSNMAIEESPFDGSRTEFSIRNPKIPRLTRSMTAGKGQGVYSAEPFEQIDKELETVQTLCEIGAHQFLRDGTCATELAGAKDRLVTVKTIAEEQRALYAAEAEAEAAMQPEQPDAMRERTRAVRDASSLHSQGVPAADPHQLAVDPYYGSESMAVDSMIAVDPAATGDSGIAVDSAMIVDPSVAIDSRHNSTTAPTVDSGIVVDSSMPAVDTDFKSASAKYGDLAIAIDQSEDSNSFHIDLTSFRRTREI